MADVTANDGVLDAMAAASGYPRSSRYHGIGLAVHTAPDGTEVPYLRRRLLPAPPGPEADGLVTHTVSAGERPDLLGYRYYGNADQWWRIADANPVLDPRELTANPGDRVNVALPGGFTGVVNG
jgi:hypothetical protein